MNPPLIHSLYAALTPWMALALLFLGRNPFLSRYRIIGSLLLAFFLLRIPVEGWSLFAWCRAFEINDSFTLTGLLGIALCQRLSGRRIFRPQDWDAAWIFGAVTALILYPMGLGLTSIDPYTWGWERILPIAMAAVASILLLTGNRFGIVLLLPLVGFLLHLQESSNFWDALVDPFYGAVSLIVIGWFLLARFRIRP